MLSTKQNRNNIVIKIILEITLLCTIGVYANILLLFLAQNLALDNITQIKNNELSTIRLDKLIPYLVKKRPVYINIPGADQITAFVDNYDSADSLWAIVNKSHSISTEYIPESLIIPNVATRTDKSADERSVRTDMNQAVIDLFSAAKTDGYELMIGSGYRSAALQSIYFYSLAGSIGEEQANISIARPGESEHQTGLAIDISTVSYECYLDNCFADTDGGQWLANNAYKYGFILRYPENKTDITGYMYESWHYRYVGIDLATALYQSGLTLEEAWPYLQKAQEILENNGAI